MSKNSKPLNTVWFKTQLNRAGLSQREVAKSLGVHHSIISHIFSGRRKIQLDEAPKWADLLGVTVDEIMAQAGVKNVSKSSTDSTKVEIKGSVDGDLRVHWEKLKSGMAFVHAPFKVIRGGKLGALRCQTSGSPFDGYDGAILFYYVMKEGGIDPESVGRICLCMAQSGKQEGQFLVRVVKRGYEPGKFNLYKIDGKLSEESVELKHATPVVWIKL